ncbi:MAG TPA: 2-C-methyl-D-erythritol 2,4-cyclodiphosphate synthase [Candidatus Hydrogenedentes bacterium]|nr:2-C-methyl-D-erythritol 2,4-cyclodiphosphate synthase [Candidatus Hydrogenedentota bacterium]
MRIGIGYDLHRLVPGRPLILGGVTISHEKGLEGHSDADVLTHAIIDALLGALALGDIGAHFPDTDPRYKDADSLKLLENAYALVRAKGYRILNIDSIVVAERPKLRPHIDAIRAKLAQTLALDVQAVSVKAKTNEKAGPEGHEEAISAQAVVLLQS